MARNRYYYYDDERSSFAELSPARPPVYAQAAAVLVVALLLAGGFAWLMDAQWIGTPEEAALRAENEALQAQVEQAGARMERFSEELSRLAETDQELYRKLLQAEPISEDVRQVGVGGADAYDEFDGFSQPTAQLLRTTAASLDELERRMTLQSASFARLSAMAQARQDELAQLPAILPANGPVVSGYGLRRHPILRVQKMHDGLDLLMRVGSPVVAPGDGVVARTGYSPTYGRYVELRHPATGYTTFYAHLSSVPSHVKKGRAVKRGERIALSGNTGRSTGPHLHYEVRDAEGQTVNPVYFFAPSMTPEKYQKLLAESERAGTSLD